VPHTLVQLTSLPQDASVNRGHCLIARYMCEFKRFALLLIFSLTVLVKFICLSKCYLQPNSHRTHLSTGKVFHRVRPAIVLYNAGENKVQKECCVFVCSI